MSQRFIKLTDLEGKRLYVGIEWVGMVREPMAFEGHSGAGSVVVMSGREVWVRETAAEIYDKLCDGVSHL